MVNLFFERYNLSGIWNLSLVIKYKVRKTASKTLIRFAL